MSRGEDLILDLILGRIRAGSIEVRFPDGSRRRWSGRLPGPGARVELHDWRLIRRLATTGAMGLADGWIAGEFDSPDLAALIELSSMHLEPEHRTRLPAWARRAGRSAWRAVGSLGAPKGPLRTTVEHYDLGNEFFGAWLDPTMTYSSAIFAREDMTLEEAQHEKIRRLAEITGLREGMRVLEIGSGWGGFATYAAGDLGCEVTTVTVSKEQAHYVEQLVTDRGLGGRVDVRLEDYLQTTGRYDAVISVEMIESIPARRWPGYFRAIHDRLVPGGRAGLQVIVVADHHWDESNASDDFARRFIFPGGQVPAPKVVRGDSEAAQLRIVRDDGFGDSYARTLATWRANFDAAWPQLSAMGFDEAFKRMWQYYLSYCGGGFAARRVDVRQMVFERDPSDDDA